MPNPQHVSCFAFVNKVRRDDLIRRGNSCLLTYQCLVQARTLGFLILQTICQPSSIPSHQGVITNTPDNTHYIISAWKSILQILERHFLSETASTRHTHPSRPVFHTTTTMNDGSVRNVVILGAAWAGQSAAHYFIRHILPSLKSTSGSLYRVVLIDASSHFYYKTAAPRALVDSKAMPHKDIFTPIEQGFKQYGANGVTFHHAEVTSIDRAESLVHFKMNGGGKGEVKYYALIIATGTRTPTPLTSLHGDYSVSQRAIDSMNDRLRTAKEVIITGGGPVGIETAGESKSTQTPPFDTVEFSRPRTNPVSASQSAKSSTAPLASPPARSKSPSSPAPPASSPSSAPPSASKPRKC